MRISDLIAQFISNAMEDDGIVELQRSALADRFKCAPSQINYVISTRFLPEHGYHVESRRGGGGFIRITRISNDRSTVLMHVVNSIGDAISLQSSAAILRNLMDMKAIAPQMAGLIYNAVTESALSPAPPSLRPVLRARIMKQCLVSLPSE